MIATNIAEAAVSMAEAQAYARVETGEEEALLAGLVRTASALCESFTGQVLVARPFEEMLPPGGQWQRLGLTPVRAVEEVALVGTDGSTMVLAADPGRSVPDPDVPVGRSELALFELPALGEAPEPGPRLFTAASNQGKWKSLPIELRLGLDPLPGQAIIRRAVLGMAESVLQPRAPMILDELSSVTVRLVNNEQLLINADSDALMAGANLALIGEELVQFGRAEQLGPGLFRLSRLLRGRRGTEWAAYIHGAAERFCLFNPAALQRIDLPAAAVGAGLMVVSHGVGDVAPLPDAERQVSGEAMRPPSVCHLKGWLKGSSVQLSWVRRSHRGWAWNDTVGVSTDSFPEAYRVTVSGPAGQLVTETDAPLAGFEVTALPAEPGQAVEIEVQMIGPMAMSRPQAISLTL